MLTVHERRTKQDKVSVSALGFLLVLDAIVLVDDHSTMWWRENVSRRMATKSGGVVERTRRVDATWLTRVMTATTDSPIARHRPRPVRWLRRIGPSSPPPFRHT